MQLVLFSFVSEVEMGYALIIAVVLLYHLSMRLFILQGGEETNSYLE